MSTITTAPVRPRNTRRTRVNYQIDKAVPIPPKHRRSVEPIYPFDRMEIGDSFAVASVGHKTYHRIYQSARIYANRNNKSFVVRALTEHGQPVVRAWRINPDEA